MLLDVQNKYKSSKCRYKCINKNKMNQIDPCDEIVMWLYTILCALSNVSDMKMKRVKTYSHVM
jgi:hypothetical protein